MGQTSTKEESKFCDEYDDDQGDSSEYSYESTDEEDGEDAINLDQPQDKPEETKERIQIIQLQSLSDEELQSHLSKYGPIMTKHDIRNIACEQTYELVRNQQWYQQRDLMALGKDGGETKEGKDGQESAPVKSHMDVALDILKLSPEIRSLRFKVVPAKLSESKFWAAVFYLLEFYASDELGASETIATALRKKKTLDDNPSSTPSKEAVNGISSNGTHAPKQMTLPQSNEELVKLLKEKDEEIRTLKLELTKVRKDLKNALQTSQSTSANSTINKVGKQNQKKGKWIMSKESQEFLLLDEDIKRQLREGKQKRIQAVHEEMKFIMDSDDMKDSIGYWDGTGCTVYDN